MDKLDIYLNKKKSYYKKINKLNKEIALIYQERLNELKEVFDIDRVEYNLIDYNKDGFYVKWRIVVNKEENIYSWGNNNESIYKYFLEILRDKFKDKYIEKCKLSDFLIYLFDSCKEEWDDYIEWKEDDWVKLEFSF